MSSVGRGAAWLNRQKRDIYVRRARQDSWRSRAVYKLIEIDKNHKLTWRGARVVDLGAAPGSWSQYLAKRVSCVVSCDLKDMEPIDGVHHIRGDFSDSVVCDQISKAIGHSADLIVSDCAPDTSGIPEVDQASMLHLIGETMALANRLITPSGRVLLKILQGSHTQELWRDYKSKHASIRVLKPAASRAESREAYWLVHWGKGSFSGR